MKVFLGVDLGSTATKAVLLDDAGRIVGEGMAPTRSDYSAACAAARGEALADLRFRAMRDAVAAPAGDAERVRAAFDRARAVEQDLRDLEALAAQAHVRPLDGRLAPAIATVFDRLRAGGPERAARRGPSDTFRDRLAREFLDRAEDAAARFGVPLEALMDVFDQASLAMEKDVRSGEVPGFLRAVAARALPKLPRRLRSEVDRAAEAAERIGVEEAGRVGTGYGRRRLPFPPESLRSEILCHGRAAHFFFPGTATVLDIGGQDTKAIQLDSEGRVISFQMNDRCAAGGGRYLGYIAAELDLGVHELGPLALQAREETKISSTCTVFAGAELREKLAEGGRREDILAGLHRAIVRRALSLLARSGGVRNPLTFTGGVASNVAVVRMLREMVTRAYGPIEIHVHPRSLYMGAAGAALLARAAARGEG